MVDALVKETYPVKNALVAPMELEQDATNVKVGSSSLSERTSGCIIQRLE